MITKQQKYINEHDLHGDDFWELFEEPDEVEDIKNEDSDDEPQPNHKSHS